MHYVLLQAPPIPGDPTPFIEDEDFDFGLFVRNISRSSERRKVLLGQE